MPFNLGSASFGSTNLPEVQGNDPAMQTILNGLETRRLLAELAAKREAAQAAPTPTPTMPDLPYNTTNETGFWKQFLGGLKESATGAGARKEANLEAINRQKLTGVAQQNADTGTGQLGLQTRRFETIDTPAAQMDQQAFGEKQRVLGRLSPMAQSMAIYPNLRPEDVGTAQDMAARGDRTLAGLIPVETGTKGPQSPDVLGRLAEIQAQGDQQARVAQIRESGQGSSTGVGAALTPEGVDYAATQYRVTGQMPALGMGNASARSAIINAAAGQAAKLNQTPAASIQRQAAYKADAQSLGTIRKLSTTAQSFEEKANMQAEMVLDLSRKVDRTQLPFINAALLSGQRNIAGDANTQLLFNALATFTAEYSKIMEGSTGSVAASTDASRRIASDLVPAKLNKGALEATVRQMQKEMRFTIMGYDATVDSITSRMGGTPPAVSEPSVTPVATGLPTEPPPDQSGTWKWDKWAKKWVKR